MIENISFSNITIDRNYGAPVRIEIAPHNLCRGIRYVYFTGVRARSVGMPVLKGREDSPLGHISFNDCRFTRISYKDIPTKYAARLAAQGDGKTLPVFREVKDLYLNGTFFDL